LNKKGKEITIHEGNEQFNKQGKTTLKNE